MNDSNFERFLFRQVKEEKSSKPRYTVGAISEQLKRGDMVIAEDAWEAAESCYLAAYFLNGGKGPVIRAKIELAKQLTAVASIIAEAGVRIESARYFEPTLRLILDELGETFDMVYMLRMELPRSERLINLELALSTAVRKGRLYLAEGRSNSKL